MLITEGYPKRITVSQAYEGWEYWQNFFDKQYAELIALTLNK